MPRVLRLVPEVPPARPGAFHVRPAACQRQGSQAQQQLRGAAGGAVLAEGGIAEESLDFGALPRALVLQDAVARVARSTVCRSSSELLEFYATVVAKVCHRAPESRIYGHFPEVCLII